MAEPDQGPIPYARFVQEIQKRTALQEQIKVLEEKLGGIEGTHATALKEVTDERDAAVSTLQTDRLDMDVDRALMAEGVTGEGVQFFRYKYDQVPKAEDGSKPAFGDWFTGYKGENTSMVDAFKAKTEPTQPVQPVQPAQPGQPQQPTQPVQQPGQPPAPKYAWQRPAKPVQQPAQTTQQPVQTVQDPGKRPGGIEVPAGAPNHTDLRDMSDEDFKTTMVDMGWMSKPKSTPAS